MGEQTADKEKLNLGRIITAFNLERRVLANGVLSSGKLEDRAALSKGMLNGLLEQGRWQQAVRLVYGQSPMHTLFDGQWSEFEKAVIDAAKIKPRFAETEIGKETLGFLLQNWDSTPLYELALQPGISIDDTISIVNNLTKRISDDQKKRAYQIIAERYEKTGNQEKAYSFFAAASDYQHADNVYHQLFEGKGDVKSLIHMAKELDKNGEPPRNQRLTALIKKAISDEEFIEIHSRWSNGEMILDVYKTANDNSIQLTSEEKQKLTELTAKSISDYRLRDHPELKQAWAIAHVKDDPKKAYQLFTKLNYEGSERLAAARQALVNLPAIGHRDHASALSVQDIEKKDLVELANTKIPLNIQVDIAEHLKDAAKLREFSKTYHDQATKKGRNKEEREKLLNKAYHLWIRGEGDANGSYINNIRQQLAKKELKEEKSKAYMFWLDDSDKIGHTQIVDLLLEKGRPRSAYDLIKRHEIDNTQLMQRAREGVVKNNPEFALEHFMSAKDQTGTDLAMNALRTKYKINQGSVDTFLDLMKKEE